MNRAELIAWIDKADYESLLRKWRFAPAGDPFFQGDVCDYYINRLGELKSQLTHKEAVAISKKVWRK